MTTLPPPTEFLAIQQVIHDLWCRTDRVIDKPAEELFADDGIMHIGTLKAEGRAAIDRYNADRRASEEISGRRVRHFCTNTVVTDYTPGTVSLRCSLLVFQGFGLIPFESSVPSNIADFVIRLREEPAHGWRIAELSGTAIFAGPGAPANARRSA